MATGADTLDRLTWLPEQTSLGWVDYAITAEKSRWVTWSPQLRSLDGLTKLSVEKSRWVDLNAGAEKSRLVDLDARAKFTRVDLNARAVESRLVDLTTRAN